MVKTKSTAGPPSFNFITTSPPHQHVIIHPGQGAQINMGNLCGHTCIYIATLFSKIEFFMMSDGNLELYNLH